MTAQVIRLKTRHSGDAGAPTALKPGEPAFNAVDGKLYIGIGDDGNGNAASVIVVASTALLSDSVTKSYVDSAVADATPNVGTGLTLISGSNQIGLADDVALSGAPTVPTPADNDDSVKIANTEFVMREITQLYNKIVNASSAEYDTIKEVFTYAQENRDARELLNTATAAKCAKDQNLNDLADKVLARTNLGLKTLATQDAGSVNITGGTIGSDVVFQGAVYGGTF